tara:strand:- start:888 stop:1718 length:831 start_codon:yes stop_codon:yes gene_type:complete
MRLKHNKKRNTAFLYETLVQELAKCAVNRNYEKRDAIISLIKRHFSGSTDLKRELLLYTTLSETRGVSEKIATRLIEEVRKSYEGLDQTVIFEAQTALIKDINSQLGSSVFSNFVQNYRNLASVQQIFNKDMKPKERVLLEDRVASLMMHVGDRALEPNRVETVDNIVLRTFIKKFNDKYKDLHEEQKGLLTRHVLSFQDNAIELKIFLNEELGRLKTELSRGIESEEIVTDKTMLKKARQVVTMLENFKGIKIDPPALKKILQIQNLVREINSDG